MEHRADAKAQSSVNRAVAAGQSAFGPAWEPRRIAVAPGRIELLGNHLDYNGGPVLAAAIDRFVATAVGFAADPGDHRLIAVDSPQPEVVHLGDIQAPPASPPTTADYVRGALAELAARGLAPAFGTHIAVAGNVPLGFGVSSSAALCVSLTLALADPRPSNRDLVLIAQAAEHRAGSPCGTMDQSASVAGGVIDFDAGSLTVTPMAPDLGEFVFAVADSGVSRSLGTSSYPTRVAEGQQALAIARRVLDEAIPHLAAITPQQLEQLVASGSLSQTLARRLRHVVGETQRVAEGRHAISRSDWESFGRLMTDSGRSSATLYEISHPEVEELVAVALAQPDVLGARMMGGGEGGAVLALLRRDQVNAFENGLRAQFYQARGRGDEQSLVHTCAFSAGAAVVQI